jgi:cbb3-type cytochrome oxidase subunit 3
MISRSVAISFWFIAAMALFSYACVITAQYERLFP